LRHYRPASRWPLSAALRTDHAIPVLSGTRFGSLEVAMKNLVPFIKRALQASAIVTALAMVEQHRPVKEPE